MSMQERAGMGMNNETYAKL